MPFAVFCLTKPTLDPLAFSWPRIVYHFSAVCVRCALDSTDRGGRSSTLFSTALIGVGIAGPEGQVHRRLHGLHTLSRVPGQMGESLVLCEDVVSVLCLVGAVQMHLPLPFW